MSPCFLPLLLRTSLYFSVILGGADTYRNLNQNTTPSLLFLAPYENLCNSRIVREIARPRPVPFVLLRDGSTFL